MLSWLRKLVGGEKPAPLAGAPRVRRQKTYSAQSGYVYQYYYEGSRPIAGGREYVFDVSYDRKTSFPASVVVRGEGIAQWNQEHGRELTESEQYAIAKLALMQAFDERDDPAGMRDRVTVHHTDVATILTTLGRD
jgi:hypothetical protein